MAAVLCAGALAIQACLRLLRFNSALMASWRQCFPRMVCCQCWRRTSWQLLPVACSCELNHSTLTGLRQAAVCCITLCACMQNNPPVLGTHLQQAR